MCLAVTKQHICCDYITVRKNNNSCSVEMYTTFYIIFYFVGTQVIIAVLQHGFIHTYTYMTLMAGLQCDRCSEKSRLDEKTVCLSSKTLQPRPAEGVGGHGLLHSTQYSKSTSLCNFQKCCESYMPLDDMTVSFLDFHCSTVNVSARLQPPH